MYAETYARNQARIVRFLDGRDTEITVPATPEWTALDVVRHLTGVSADIAKRRFGDFASEAWTDAQVRARMDMTYEEIVSEWDTIIGPAAYVLDRVDQLDLPPLITTAAGRVSPSVIPAMAIGDLLHHEFDLRHAYGDTSERERLDVQFAAAGHVKSLRGIFANHGLPTIRVDAIDSGMGWDVGMDEPVATLAASSFELIRAIGGRRTRGEISAMGWDSDPESFIDHMTLPQMKMRETSLGE